MTERARTRRRPTVLLAVALLAASAVPHATTIARSERIPPVEDQLIVRYAANVPAPDRRAIRARHGLTRLAATPSGRLELVTARGRSAAALRAAVGKEPGVVGTAINGTRELADDITDEPLFGDLWGLHNDGQTLRGAAGTSGIDIDGPQALRIVTGSAKTVVAVIDDGIDFDHPDLAQRAWVNPGEAGALATNGIDDDGNGYIDDVHGWDFCTDDATVHDSQLDWHGTHVAGTIAASLDGQGMVGVAPGVRLMALKAFENGRACPFGDFPIIEAIEYATAMGVRIVNASWGGTSDNGALSTAIAESGALVVAAAGNQGWDLDGGVDPRFYPAAYPLANIISVGAIDQRGLRATFSNRGTTSVDLAGPGVNIRSTIPARDTCPAPCYAWANGTSMAAPHVAGVAALAGSQDAALLASPTKLKQRLLDRGRSLAGGRDWLLTGRLVNALRAVDILGPVASAPDRFVVRPGAIIGTTTPLTVRWPAATDAASAVADYRLDKRRGEAVHRVVDGASAREATTTIGFGVGYTFALSARDTLGNRGATVVTPTITAALHQETATPARYGRGWTRRTDAAALGGAVMSARRARSTVAFTTSARTIAVVATTGPGRGAVRVYVDGTLKTTVELGAVRTVPRTVIHASWWSTKATHEIRLVTVDDRPVDIDGWVVVR